jgi:hypothetical protein
MCPPCRNRYRGYGTTKRRKWKAERDAFDRDLASMRDNEDERRKEQGLPVSSTAIIHADATELISAIAHDREL